VTGNASGGLTSTRQEFVIVCTGKAAAKCRKAVDLHLRLDVERPAGLARLAFLAKLAWVGMPKATLLAVCNSAIFYGWTVTVARVGNLVLHLKPRTSATNKSGLHREVNAASGNDSLASVNYEDTAFWETCDEYLSTNREFVIVCTGKAAARCRKAVDFLERSPPKGLERLTFLVQWVIAMRVSTLTSICDKATVLGWSVTVRRIENQVVHLDPPSESATDVRRGE
jgi:hypothetical protein